jgi:hypothetical protein
MLKRLDNDENNPFLLSSFLEDKQDLKIKVIIGGESFINDRDDIFTVDDDFIKENVVYTLSKYKQDNKQLSQLFIDAVQSCYSKGDSNYQKITSDFILSSVSNGKIIKKELAQVFGIMLGVYICVTKGYKNIFIDNIDAFLHPARQRDILPKAKQFSEKLNSLIK